MARLRRETRDARTRLTALAAIVRATGREIEPARIVDLAMGQIALMTGVRRWILALAVPGQGTLVIESTSGRGLGGLRGTAIPAGEGLLGRAAQRRQVVVAGGDGAPRRPDLPRGVRAGSAVAVPLLSRGRAIGVMALVDGKGAAGFKPADARLVTLLLEPVAVALDSALLLRRSEELSVTDDLTQLYNSRFLNAALRREVERSRRYRVPLSLIFLDLDGFKSINDRHGHLCGSRALVEVGAVIRATVREIDVVARFGGDEFTVILPQTGRAGARVIAERIRERIAATHYLKAHGLEVRVTASLGIATYPEHGVTGDALVARADQAMYSAKGAGKDQVAVADARQPARQVA
jgi:diguanylate cyclase (GGDEF)-like protein